MKALLFALLLTISFSAQAENVHPCETKYKAALATYNATIAAAQTEVQESFAAAQIGADSARAAAKTALDAAIAQAHSAYTEAKSQIKGDDAADKLNALLVRFHRAIDIANANYRTEFAAAYTEHRNATDAATADFNGEIAAARAAYYTAVSGCSVPPPAH